MKIAMSLKLESTADKVMKELKAEDRRLSLKAARAAMRKIRAATPVGKTGNLRKSVGVKAWQTVTGAGVGYMKRRGGAHAHLVDQGHDMVVGGKKVGRVQGKNFFAPAWNAALPEVIAIISEERNVRSNSG